MTLYEINREIEQLIENAVDTETGELILDQQELYEFELAWNEKIENLALYIKNLNAEARELKAEEQTLASRRKSAENKSERLTAYLDDMLHGDPFKTSKVEVTYRRSTVVQVDDEFVDWAMSSDERFLRYKQPEPDKRLIGEMLRMGQSVPHAALVSELRMTIK